MIDATKDIEEFQEKANIRYNLKQMFNVSNGVMMLESGIPVGVRWQDIKSFKKPNDRKFVKWYKNGEAGGLVDGPYIFNLAELDIDGDAYFISFGGRVDNILDYVELVF